MYDAEHLETEEDLQLVKDYILLPLLLDVLERDMIALGTVKLKMDVVYARALLYCSRFHHCTLHVGSETNARQRDQGVRAAAHRVVHRGPLFVQGGINIGSLCFGVW